MTKFATISFDLGDATGDVEVSGHLASVFTSMGFDLGCVVVGPSPFTGRDEVRVTCDQDEFEKILRLIVAGDLDVAQVDFRVTHH